MTDTQLLCRRIYYGLSLFYDIDTAAVTNSYYRDQNQIP